MKESRHNRAIARAKAIIWVFFALLVASLVFVLILEIQR